MWKAVTENVEKLIDAVLEIFKMSNKDRASL